MYFAHECTHVYPYIHLTKLYLHIHMQSLSSRSYEAPSNEERQPSVTSNEERHPSVTSNEERQPSVAGGDSETVTTTRTSLTKAVLV